jgi:hypothetical protein
MSEKETMYKPVVDFLTGRFPYVAELTLFFMAFQAAMKVRTGPNKDGQLHWFHAFLLSTIMAFGGGMFNPIWMGGTAASVANDLCLGTALAAFYLVNFLPFDRGVHFGRSMPGTFITVAFAQLFRSLGTCKFTTQAFQAFKESPSAYYSIPLLGPIFYGTMLGNMGALVLNGIPGYVAKGMPWGFQNGKLAEQLAVYCIFLSGGNYLTFEIMNDRTFCCHFLPLVRPRRNWPFGRISQICNVPCPRSLSRC